MSPETIITHIIQIRGNINTISANIEEMKRRIKPLQEHVHQGHANIQDLIKTAVANGEIEVYRVYVTGDQAFSVSPRMDHKSGKPSEDFNVHISPVTIVK